MRHRDDRDGHAGESPDLRREHAARVDDDLGFDRLPIAAAGLDLDARDAPAPHVDPHHPGVLADGGATGARARRERLCQPGRVEPAVGRQPDGAEDAIERHQRELRLRLLGRDQLEWEAEGLRPAGLALELLEPLLRGREPQRPDLVPADVDAGLLCEPPVEGGAVHHHPGQGRGRSQLPDEARRVERRAGRELRPIDKRDVAPTELRQVIGDRRPAHAAADDHRPRVLDQALTLPAARRRDREPSLSADIRL